MNKITWLVSRMERETGRKRRMYRKAIHREIYPGKRIRKSTLNDPLPTEGFRLVEGRIF